jgi:lactoylglutathione lyase
MQTGAFSISLAVQDLAASRAFYEALGFSAMGGDASQNWLILKNGDAIIGLFQGMFEGNIITFNPGWDQAAKNVDPFDDVRQIEAQLKEAGIDIGSSNTADKDAGPAHITLTDPDGNAIMVDQHR